jgi:hypothetical protein
MGATGNREQKTGNIPSQKKMGGKGDALAAARPWVVLKVLQLNTC